MSTTAKRRRKGEGTIHRYHNHPTCPKAVTVTDEDGKTSREVPEHDCRAGYRAQVWVRTTAGKKIRKQVYGKTEREVMRKLRELAVAEGTGRLVEGSGLTVRDWMRTDMPELDNWWTMSALAGSRPLKGTTAAGYRSKIERYILPELGATRLDRLTGPQVTAFYASLRKRGLAEATIRQTHAILRRALVVAERNNLVAFNAAAKAEPPSTETGDEPALDPEQALRVLDAAGDDARWYVALLCGLRQGEVLALRWKDIHLDGDADNPEPYLVVRERVARETGKGMVFDTPKSKKSTDREVPLVPWVVDRLRKLRESSWATDPEDLVFPNTRGNPREPSGDSKAWHALLSRAGIVEPEEGGFTLRSARQTTSKLLELAGVTDRVVQEILGHAYVAMTHHYQRRNKAAVRDGMRALGELLSDFAPSPENPPPSPESTPEGSPRLRLVQ